MPKATSPQGHKVRRFSMRPFQTRFAHPSDRHRLRGWLIASFLCVVLGGGLGPAPAQAIPTAGDYVFVIGDPNISGSFTSTGSALSKWSFSSDLLGRVEGEIPPPILSWSNDTDSKVWANSNATFSTQNVFDAVKFTGGDFATFRWNDNPSILTAFFRVDRSCCDAFYDPEPTVSFARSVSIPDTATFLFMAIGLLGLAVVYQWLQHRQVRLPG